jgi:hypothetical protein
MRTPHGADPGRLFAMSDAGWLAIYRLRPRERPQPIEREAWPGVGAEGDGIVWADFTYGSDLGDPAAALNDLKLPGYGPEMIDYLVAGDLETAADMGRFLRMPPDQQAGARIRRRQLRLVGATDLLARSDHDGLHLVIRSIHVLAADSWLLTFHGEPIDVADVFPGPGDDLGTGALLQALEDRWPVLSEVSAQDAAMILVHGLSASMVPASERVAVELERIETAYLREQAGRIRTEAEAFMESVESIDATELRRRVFRLRPLIQAVRGAAVQLAETEDPAHAYFSLSAGTVPLAEEVAARVREAREQCEKLDAISRTLISLAARPV